MCLGKREGEVNILYWPTGGLERVPRQDLVLPVYGEVLSQICWSRQTDMQVVLLFWTTVCPFHEVKKYFHHPNNESMQAFFTTAVGSSGAYLLSIRMVKSIRSRSSPWLLPNGRKDRGEDVTAVTYDGYARAK